MKHYALIKVAPSANVEDVQKKIRKAYDKLDGDLDWLNRPVVFRNCLEKDANMDIMSEVELDGEEQLEIFLNHPRYIKLMEELRDDIVAQVMFDHY